MCTLTFLPTADGYLAGMNRDELGTRPVARPPQVHMGGATKALYPTEPAGGTWIACNQRGVLLALLNWNDAENHRVHANTTSRGLVIPALIGEKDLAAADSAFERMTLAGILPFRVFGFFAGKKTAVLWRWNGTQKDRFTVPWSRGHWFSSRLSDRTAELERGIACEAAALKPDFGSPESLRLLHASHVPAAGPFSVCVHRPDATTVSYTEVVCREGSLAMRYVAGNPCRKPQPQEISESLLDRDDSSKAA